MEGIQLDIFDSYKEELVDQVQKNLQTQFTKLIKNYEINCKWELQNRVEYRVYFSDSTKCTIQASIKSRIIERRLLNDRTCR